MRRHDSNNLWSAFLERRRRRLGISRAALARRAGVGLTTLSDILSGRETNPRLSSMHAVASALGVCVGIGEGAGITETIRADDFRRQRAEEKAKQLAGMVQATMGLEAQAVDRKTLDSLIEENVHKLLAGSGRRLWED